MLNGCKDSNGRQGGRRFMEVIYVLEDVGITETVVEIANFWCIVEIITRMDNAFH